MAEAFSTKAEGARTADDPQTKELHVGRHRILPSIGSNVKNGRPLIPGEVFFIIPGS